TIRFDSVNVAADSIIKKPKSALEGILTYNAKDITSINNKKKTIYLYNQADMTYKDMSIKAGVITINYETNEVNAGRIKDSLGNYSQAPVFTQGADVIEPDSIRFNFTTKKALIWNSKTEQSGGKILAELTKKVNDSVLFINRGIFTTSTNLEDPEYYFLMRKFKAVPGKKVVAGWTNMYIYNVPTPIGVPFAFFPLTNKRSSGVIVPSFGEQAERGYFLQNGGYYFAVSDYLDLAVVGDYYTNGSYGLRVDNQYNKRYKFNGNLSFRFENLITSEKGFPDYSKSNIYNLRWSHNKDSKSNPNSRFSASVNIGSSTYFRESINQLNISSALNNTLASSISYSKSFPGEPAVNVSLTATHSQNTNTQQINLTLPTFQGSVGRMFPFAPKNGSKKGILQNIQLQYNVRGEQRIQTTDSLFLKKEMFDNAKKGMQHTIPLSTNFKILKFLSVSASTNFQESWTFETISKSFDQTTQTVVTTPVKGFDAFRTYNFSTGVGTTVYGMFPFKKGSKIEAIRHVVRPSISYNINPSFEQYYDTYEVIDADGNTTADVEYTRFEGSMFGSPSNRYSSSIGFSLGNNIEAKVRSRDSTEVESKKIVILNSLNFSTNYNMSADSLNLSPINMTGSTQLFKKELNLNFGATFDPYALDENKRKINTFSISNGGGLARMTSANVSMSYNLKGGQGKDADSDSGGRSQSETVRNGGRDDDLFGRAEDFADRRFSEEEDQNKAEEAEENDLFTYTIPWNLRLSYALNYNNSAGQKEISSHSLMFSGDVEISPKWRIGASSGYDLKNTGFTFTQLRFERDLLSWRMNFSWVPFSTYKQWNFFIGIKSGILSDIKYDKRRQRDQQL
ncbi:MAG: putative LPS assembly protein LptD, partial [Flavobacteriaceae bacterium]|nr:putative LPS assembly protein LptD [Flavobacteriaceae bacterium]